MHNQLIFNKSKAVVRLSNVLKRLTMEVSPGLVLLDKTASSEDLGRHIGSYAYLIKYLGGGSGQHRTAGNTKNWSLSQ